MRHFLIAFLVTTLVYFAGVFLSLAFDVREWPAEGRFGLIAISSVFSGMFISEYETKRKKAKW